MADPTTFHLENINHKALIQLTTVKEATNKYS